jgi:Zn-dependent metalloprotease
MHNHNPIHCILPPHILTKIAESGTPEQRAKATRTLAAADQMRDRRNSMSMMTAFAAETVGSAQKTRAVYDAQFGPSLPGTLARQEGSPPVADVAVNEAYDGSGVTYDLFFDIYGRNSIDGNGLNLTSTVHYQKSYDNAFWNGKQMVYGDGDDDLPPAQRLFNRFTIAIDVIGHELTHGVTQHAANLAYQGQSGALNESWSDVFGSLVKQYSLKQSARDADWIIGQGLITPNINGIGLRSMKAPGTAYDDPMLGKDPQPAHMQDYLNTTDDNGGVHINSGIPNHAFYVAATEIGGFAWNKAGLIWYKALTGQLTQTATFQQAANLTYAVAGQLYGQGSLEQIAVKTGWAAVGLTVDTSLPPTPPPVTGKGCLTQIISSLGLLTNQEKK